MAVLSPDTVIARATAPLAAEIDGETVLMSIERGRYYGLADTGRDIWNRLEHPIRVSDLCTALAADYDGPPERVAADAMVFLGRLIEENLIEITG